MNDLTDRNKDSFFAVILYLIWPFLAAVSAVKNYKRPWAKNVVWAFIAFYGFTFSIGSESENSDIVRYVDEYQHLHQVEMDFTRAKHYYEQSGEIDVVRTIIAVSLSRITDSQPILTLVFAIIFGFFYSRNMWYVLERLEGRLQPITLLLLACFFLIVPMWQINAFRMWTAAHIFLYGLLPYLCEGKKNGVWISGMSIFVHFSFLVPFGVLLAYMVAGNWLTIYFIFFLTTLFISEINLTVINNLIETYTPEAFQERTASYRVDEMPGETTVGDATQSRRWYAMWYRRALRYSLITLLIGLFITGREYVEKNRDWMSLFCFVLLYFGVANLLGSISSSARLLNVASLFALPLLILYMQNVPQEKVMKRLTLFVTPALLLFLVVAIRIGFYSLSATSILGNPIIAVLLFDDHMSLNDLMRMIL